MKNNLITSQLIFILAAITFSQGLAAGPTSPQGITLQGTILKPDGTPQEGTSVNFIVQIRSSGPENCLLYQESHTLNMSSSGGAFSLVMGSGTRSGVSFHGTSTLKQVFDNSAGVINSLTCVSGTSYTPATGHARQTVVTFDDGSGPQTVNQALNVQSVPYALYADTLSGKSSTDFIQVNTSTAAVSQSNLESVFTTNGAVTDLVALITGTSTKYVTNSSTGGAKLPSYTTGTPPSSPQAGDIWYNSSTNTIQYFNGTAPQTIGSGSGTVTSVIAGTGLSGGTINTTGTISMPNTGTAGTYTKVTTDAQGRVTAGSTLHMSDLKSTVAGDLFNSPACSSNQTLSWSAITDQFTCQNVTVSAGGSNTQVQFNNSSALGGDSNFVWDNTNKRLGVSAATPAAKLDVGGEVKVGDTGLACSATTKGSIRYNNTSSVLEFCNGTGWNLVQAAACSDATPNSFTFNDESNQTTSTLVTSNIVQVGGINCTVPVTISGTGSPQYQICSDAACASPVQGWTSSPSSIVSGQYMQIRQTSDAAGGANIQAMVIAGTTASVWSVSTAGGDCVGTTPPVGTVCADGSIYAGLSPDTNVKMFTTRCDIGQTWNGSMCTGTALTQSWNNGTTSWTTTGRTSSVTGKANSSYLFTLVDAGSTYNAATVCENLNENGNTDWYLPALNELNVMYVGKNTIRNFNTAGVLYWSSTESNSSNAWNQRFSDGGQYNASKSDAYRVRCVRR